MLKTVRVVAEMKTYCCKIGAMEAMEASLSKQFGGSIGFLEALARYSVIFSHTGHVTMAAQAPDPPWVDLAAWRKPQMAVLGAKLLKLERVRNKKRN